MPRLALVGDFDPTIKAHQAISQSLDLASRALGRPIASRWFHTSTLADAAATLEAFDGVWCVPGSPYASMFGALAAIKTARVSRVPFLGTCGGFQHAVIEYLRNVRGLAAGDHAESNPEAAVPLITPLTCSLVESHARIKLLPGSIVASACGADEIEEEFNCRYGFNERHRAELETGPLRTTGTDESGAIRVLELGGHPFFVATLFQPERRALRSELHPLIAAFTRAAAGRSSPSG